MPRTPTATFSVASLAIAILSLTTFLPQHVRAGSYSYSRIADTSGQFSYFTLWMLTNNGIVSFDAGLDSGVGGVFLGEINGVTKIVSTGDIISGYTFQYVSNGVANEAGQVVFGARNNQPGKAEGTFLYSNGSVVKLDNGAARQSPGWQWINNSGTTATNLSGLTYSDLWLFDGTQPSAHLTGSSIKGGTGSPIINESGLVAFTSATGNFAAPYGVWTWDGQTATKIFEANLSNGYSNISPVDLNSEGSILFVAQRSITSIGGAVLLLYDNGSVQTLIDTNDSPFASLYTVSLADDGGIAFWAQLDDGTTGMFTGPDPMHHAVIRSGDELDGSMVVSVNQAARAMRNNSGQIAFEVTLANGTEAIYLATPVPEPTTFALAGIGALGLLTYRIRLRFNV